MRKFLRIGLRIGMIIFLVAGCAQNMTFLAEIGKKSNGYTPNSYGYRYYHQYEERQINEPTYANEVDTAQITTNYYSNDGDL